MKPTLARKIALASLMMAVWRRKPRERVTIHSDQGSQYSSDDWLKFCNHRNLETSMRRRGNCRNNTVAESFFSNLKKQRIKTRIYITGELARADIFDCIEMFYNWVRRHNHLGGVSPEDFEHDSF
jgi:putative transposase